MPRGSTISQPVLADSESVGAGFRHSQEEEMSRPVRRGPHLGVVPQDPPGSRPLSGHPLSMAQYLEDWLWGKQALRPSTRRSYEVHVRRYLIPHLGELPVADLRASHVEAMYRCLRDRARAGEPQLSPAT